MTDTVDTFRRISLLIFKWLLFAFLALLALAALIAAGIYAYYYWTDYRHAANVSSYALTDVCKDDKFPILVAFENKSSVAIHSVSFRLAAKRKGRSGDVATYRALDSDHIIAAGETHGTCWIAPLESSVTDDPRTLTWSVENVRFTFGN